MDIEVIAQVESLSDNQLILILRGGGKPGYQHVWRGAAAVYWDMDRGGFKSSGRKGGSCAEWFGHICAVVKSELGFALILAPDTTWIGIPDSEQKEIAVQILKTTQHHDFQ